MSDNKATKKPEQTDLLTWKEKTIAFLKETGIVLILFLLIFTPIPLQVFGA